MPKTPFQMLLRGQNLVAYRNHPDDLVEAFVEKSAEVGLISFVVLMRSMMSETLRRLLK